MGIISKSVALTPGTGGGLCIAGNVLQAADIIVSTTAQFMSGVIRLGTMSVVSHAALYAGGGSVIEAIQAGVTQHSLDAAMADDVLAVAYRHPAMNALIAASIIAYAKKQVGQPYSAFGAAMAPYSTLCVTAGSQAAGFFCSELVAEAYRQAGLPLFDVPASCVTPENVAEIAQRCLFYVGHIKGNPTLFPVLDPS
jgi:cell wall-associated NlpC family hydrolase